MTRPRQSPLADATEHTAAEKARADALFASIGEAVIATDENGKIMKANGSALELFGYEESDFIGKGYLHTVHAHDAEDKPIEPLSRPVMQALQDGKKVNSTLQFIRKDGSKFPAAVTVSPIMLAGRPIGMIEVVRDITREQQIDKAKTEFVSLASHQLRTPLTAMRWYLELLLKGRMGALSPQQEASLHEVHRVSLRMIELVAALLSVARIEIGTLTVAPQPSNITQLAQDVVFELRPQIAEKNLDFVEQYDSSIPLLPLDPDLTRVIFQNLLSNAVKYTPAGGSVSLAIKRKGRHVHIKVADTGYGIPKRQQRHLFTKLFRADNVRQKDTDGTGLGLYIVQSIVENSGGKIKFESEENKGTTFYVRLPLKGMVATNTNKVS